MITSYDQLCRVLRKMWNTSFLVPFALGMLLLGQNFVETKCMVNSLFSIDLKFPIYIGRLQECVTLSHKYISFIFLMAEIKIINAINMAVTMALKPWLHLMRSNNLVL